MSSSNIRILHIGTASDGNYSTPAVQSMYQNDTYFLEKIAERWAKDQHLPQGGVVYRLDSLPSGYAGYEKARGGSTHVDRYLYGHPLGIFRSLNELYPHFKQLQDFGDPVGCPCKLCAGPGRKTSNGSNIGGIPYARSPTRGPRASSSASSRLKGGSNEGRPRGRLLSDPPTPPRGKQVDDEGSQDMYRGLLDKLRDANPDECHGSIFDSLSPDWRAGHEMLMDVLEEWRALPRYVPRTGELVLFTRTVPSTDCLAWDRNSHALRRVERSSRSWLDRASWEVGVVTQMPIEPVMTEDLGSFSDAKTQNVINSGFRIEPLPKPGDQSKSFTQQRKYLPLHLLRPFWTWKECLNGVDEQDWHPTLRHALTLASSFCVVGKYSYKGTWPDATIFAKGVFLGPELVLVGDTVRLLPRPGDGFADTVTDVMTVTSIKLRFVNLDEANDDDYDDHHPYNTCLHISGKAYTLSAKRSYDGVGKTPISPEPGLLPDTLAGYGPWYPMIDPEQTNARLELPYHRVLGRCIERQAAKAWFAEGNDIPPSPATFQAVNTKQAEPHIELGTISQGLAGMRAARAYSVAHDGRIDTHAGKQWYWAESRIEQLDLHEVNSRAVGIKDLDRSRKQMNEWRKALKLLDGRKGGIEEYQAARSQRQLELQRGKSTKAPSSSWGLMTGAAPVTDVMAGHGNSEEVDAVDMNDDRDTSDAVVQQRPGPSSILIDDEEDDIMGEV